MKKLIALLFSLLPLLIEAQTNPNTPPSNTPFGESVKTKNEGSTFNTALLFEPSQIGRGMATFSILHAMKNLPFQFKVSYGRSFDRDYVLELRDDLNDDYESLGVEAIQYIRANSTDRYNQFAFRLGIDPRNEGELHTYTWNLHYSFGWLNSSASKLPQYTINGTQSLFYKTRSFGLTFGHTYLFSEGDASAGVWGFDIGASANEFIINHSQVDMYESTVFTVYSTEVSDWTFTYLFTVYVGLGW